MSDFDKEAEREKLREKYERDKEERQATQRMSDLLLKGATMTNSHCGTCGDPLFQENGTTFCPSCHGNPDAVQGTGLEADAADADAAEDATPEETAPEAGAGPETATDERNAAADSSETADRADTDAPRDPKVTSQPSDETDSDRTDADRSRPASGSYSQSQPQTQSQPQSRTQSQNQTKAHPESPPRRDEPTPASSVDTNATDSSAGDRSAARDSLTRALEKFAAEAAATDDPRYAKECLEAAREASETLESLR
ncbi:hypothetical protein C482_03889 [Natrialba chahannaoensis JCM 10990]|uniref:Sjogrens syndrome scleroderma autoantigen 1 n=1 Tax=Natrialba chahannaoensis JCM 10990 TaxID=1227492 RepID=M0AXU3_9EURY|nr:Sjogren's syndrome/scleroderma autoantigen 1 family protein [Natrialba chahannaoensis]ELZ03132.1 hypothetical protein C482_03889 [Natrialba chahannaoensis JCM 10990]